MITTDLIIYSIFTVAIGYFMLDSVITRRKNRQLLDKLLQANLDKAIILEKFSKEMNSKAVSSLEKTDGFLRFVSESREWAFKYIEEVQAALLEFEKKVSPVLEYAKTYGSVMDSHLSKSLDSIAEAYEDLIKTLPKEDKL